MTHLLLTSPFILLFLIIH